MHPKTLRGIGQRERLYAHLCEVAAAGGPMPSNPELRALIDVGAKVGGKLADLQREGLITVEYAPNMGNGRRCTITATGHRTAWQAIRYRQPQRGTKKPAQGKTPGRRNRSISTFASPNPFSAGYSDTFLYGHLADAVRTCRRRGDVVYRDPSNKMVILINGRPGDVKARAAWHASRMIRPANYAGAGASL